jgi:hypothetical protein
LLQCVPLPLLQCVSLPLLQFESLSLLQCVPLIVTLTFSIKPLLFTFIKN